MAKPDFGRRTPWHLWLVGVVSLLWNAMGAFDYSATQLRLDTYLANFTPEQLAYFTGFPAWVDASWAIAVWFSVLGSLALLMRRGAAVALFLISFIALVVTSVHNFLLGDVSMTEIAGPEALYFTGAIYAVALALLFYARRQRMNGVLA